MKEVQMQYAIEKGTDVTKNISEVERGLECNCYCVECKGDLEAVKGPKNQKHFRHYLHPGNCLGGRETILHQRAKEILKNGTCIITEERGEINYTNPQLEESLMCGIRPDVTAEHNRLPIHFEVAVHHPMEEKKRVYLKVKGYRFVEIDLAQWIDEEPTQEELEYSVLKDPFNKEVFWNKPEILVTDKPSAISSFQNRILAALLLILTFGLLYDRKGATKKYSSRKQR